MAVVNRWRRGKSPSGWAAGRAGRALVAAAGSPAKVFLLASRSQGACAAGGAAFLVVQESVADRYTEAVRLNKVLGNLRLPGDVLVVDRAHFDAWSSVSGTAMHEAASEGRLVAES